MSASTRASRPPGRPREIAFRAGVLVALLLALAVIVGASGPDAITARGLSPAGPSRSLMAPVPTNVPYVTIDGDETISLGERYEVYVSFTDSDVGDVHAATVNYGDGSGDQTFGLDGTSFYLDHIYTAAGTFTVTVQVSDGTNTGSDDALATVQAPDIVPLVYSDDAVAPGDSVSIDWEDTNAGPGDILAGVSWTDKIYLSPNGIFGDDDDLWVTDYTVESWWRTAAGSSIGCGYEWTVADLASGDYTIFVVSDSGDAGGSVIEANEGNNVGSSTMTISRPPIADPGGPYTADVGVPITLDGSGSSDPDADTELQYGWVPNYNGTDFYWTHDGVNPAVTYDTAGEYTIALQVRDSTLLYSEIATTTITVTGAVQGVDLEPTALNAVPVDVGGNETLAVTWSVQNAGPADIAAGGFWYDVVYLSRDQQVGYDDLTIGLRSYNAESGLPAGLSYNGSSETTVPLGVGSGKWYVLLETDSSYAIDETDEADNLMVFGPITVTPLDIELQAVSIETTTPTIDAGGSISYEYTVRNNGSGAVPAGYWWEDGIYLSANATFERTQDFEVKLESAPGVSMSIETGNTYTVSTSINIGFEVPGGDYHLILVVDAFEEVSEINEANNVIASTSKVTVGALDVDLEPYEWVTAPPATATAGDSFQLQVTVRKNGLDEIPLAARWNDEAYLSADQTFDPLSDANIGRCWGAGISLSNGVYTGTVDATIPTFVANGPWYVLYVVDPWSELAETNNANNVLASVPITISGGTSVDLAVQSAVPTPNPANPGDGVTVVFTFVNNGPEDLATGIEMAYAVAYSTDATLDQGDLPLAIAATYDGLPADGTYSDSLGFTLPASVPVGDGCLLILVDISAQVVEFDEANNMFVIPFTVTAPVTNTVPAVGLGDDATVTPGTAFIRDGSFTDPDADTWKATVDYGEGAEPETLVLNADKTFSLSHTYTAAGIYTVTVTVDDGIESSSDSMEVRVGVEGVDLIVERVTPGVSEAKIGDQVTVEWVGRNDGVDTLTAMSWYDELYLSTDTTFDGSEIDSYIGWQSTSATLGPGETYTSSRTVTVPMWVTPGTYYILVHADNWDYVTESNETNNVTASGQITIGALNVDLAPVSMTPSATEVASGDQFTINVEVANTGMDDVPSIGTWANVIYLSADDTFDPAEDREFAYRWEDGPLAAKTTRTSTVYATVYFDIPDGIYTLFLVADGTDALAETNEDNNILVGSILITIDHLDLDLQAGSIGTTATEAMMGDTIPISWTETSVGVDPMPADFTWPDIVYLTTDPTGESGRTYLLEQWQNGSMLVDGQGAFNANVTLDVDLGIDPGTYYLVLEVDSWDRIYETNEENNTIVSEPIAITVPDVDLLPAFIDAAVTSVQLEDPFEVTVSTKNVGPEAVLDEMGWSDSVYLSVDDSFDPSEDFPIGKFWWAGWQLEEGSVTSTGSCEVQTREGPMPGTYHLLLVVDSDDRIPETKEDNNVLAGPTINILARDTDLVPDTVAFAPASAVPGDQVTVTWSVSNGGTSPTTRGWIDATYLSGDPVLDASDARVMSVWTDEGVPGAAAFAVSPVIPGGEYYVILHVDYLDYIRETSEENNVLVAEGKLTISGGVAVDLEPTSFTVDPPEGDPDAQLTLTYTVVNHGPDTLPAEMGHEDQIFFSRDDVIDEDDWFMASDGITEGVDANGSYIRKLTGWVPWSAEPGPAYLILSVNINYDIVETDHSNNIVVIPFTVTEPSTNEAPIADAAGWYYVDEGSSVVLDGSGSYDPEGGELTYEWDLNEDGVIDATGMSPALSATDLDGPADLTLLLTVRDAEGLVDSDYTSVFVTNVPPTVVAGEDVRITLGEAFTGTGSFTDPGAADIHTAIVDYGDGSEPVELTLSGTSFTLDHTYAAIDTYTVIVTVTDDDGGSGSDEVIVTVTESNVAPVVGPITVEPTSPVAGMVVQVSASFTDANSADTHTATIDWGDKTSDPVEASLGTVSASHIYTKQGTYTVTVTVTEDRPDALSGSATTSVTVTKMVKNVAPVALPGGPYSGVEDVAIPLDGSGSYDPDGNTPLGYAWDTSYDGRTFNTDLTGVGPDATYPDPGTYTIALQVTEVTDTGAPGLSSKIVTTTVEVVPVDANAAPVVGPVAVEPGTEVQVGTTVMVSASFSDANAGTHSATVNWGDKTSDPMDVSGGAVSASHTYTKQGRYTVTVTVSDGDLSGSASTVIQVTKPPKETTTFETQQVPVVEESTVVPTPEPTPIPTPEPTPIPDPTVVPEPTSEPEDPVEEPTPPLETEGDKDKKN